LAATQTSGRGTGRCEAISDRFDLTLECVRRYYLGINSPLEAVFARYEDFFSLFVDFRGFVEFFLLQDIVSADCSNVTFFMPFGDFQLAAVPGDLPSYISYRRRCIEFVQARNERISRIHPAREGRTHQRHRTRSRTTKRD
jgi:hypothetical protein